MKTRPDLPQFYSLGSHLRLAQNQKNKILKGEVISEGQPVSIVGDRSGPPSGERPKPTAY
jgi:hypothetical protein